MSFLKIAGVSSFTAVSIFSLTVSSVFAEFSDEARYVQ